MTDQILALRDHLVAERVTCAVMEATGDYWKPLYYLLEDSGFEVMLVNARHVKTLPGRKTDVADATRHRRDRRRHDPLPDRQAPPILGRDHARPQQDRPGG